MSKKDKNKKRVFKNPHDIDVIIPAYNASKTIKRTLASIVCQSIADDIHIYVVSDGNTLEEKANLINGISQFNTLLKNGVHLVTLEENSGPGVARQRGIEAGDSPYFTCIDADDTFNGALALEILREGIEFNDVIKCVSSVFMQLGENLQQMLPHGNDMVWMFGKLYRREFIEKYEIHFNDTRANEDTGFNTWVRLLCNNEREQIRFIQECTYYWHNKEDSITRINDGQYALDQCFCGWTDNMIYAIENVRKVRPFDEATQRWIVVVMIKLYFYYIETVYKKEEFAKQNWEYVKKFYHTCYSAVKDVVTDDIFSEHYGMETMQAWGDGHLIGMVPSMGIQEFMDKLSEEPYNPDDIYDIWEEMRSNPETAELIQNNIRCGVCKAGYTDRPNKEEKDEENIHIAADAGQD